MREYYRQARVIYYLCASVLNAVGHTNEGLKSA
jgi:hypothetical protein